MFKSGVIRAGATDALDAELIARFAVAVDLEPRPVPDPQPRALDALLACARVSQGEIIPSKRRPLPIRIFSSTG